ncbi:MAG: glycosylhydrolase-like jelly roll fold domain-containing protein, partial [Bacteroidota bacterium]
PAPNRSPSLQNQPMADEQVQALAQELWGDIDGVTVKSRKFGKGIVMSGMEMQEALDAIGLLPDCKLPADNSIHYGHRTLGTSQVYFVSNQTDKEQVVTPAFRVTGLQPELWSATTGDVRTLSGTPGEETTSVPLKLAPYESVFVVFNQPLKNTGQGSLEINYPEETLLSDFPEPWEVSFDSAKRGPKEPVKFESLIDWTELDNDQIKYYSGTAIYANSFEIEEVRNKRMKIDLGNLTSSAKVYVNGEYAGGVWTAPYALDITDWVKTGTNQLKIEVVNNWMNRLIGDQQLPEEDRPTWAPFNPYEEDSELQASGLFGPVKVTRVNY